MNDLISRSELKNFLLDSKPDDLQQSDINFLTGDIKVSLKFVLNIIDNAPTVLFPLTVRLCDKVTDEDIALLKRLMEDYKPQFLNLETERPQGEWKESKEHFYTNDGCREWTNFYCSVCDAPSSAPFNFCPVCGARMKGNNE